MDENNIQNDPKEILIPTINKDEEESNKENLIDTTENKKDDEEEKVEVNTATANLFSALFSQKKQEIISGIESKANTIYSLFPGGIKDLKNATIPKEMEDTYVVILFYCPYEFYKKYFLSEIKQENTLIENFLNIESNGSVFDTDFLYDRDDEKLEFTEFIEKAAIEKLINLDNYTDKIKTYLTELFEEWDHESKNLVKAVIEKHCKECANRIKNVNPEYYEKMDKLYKAKIDSEGFYHYLNYDDFLLIFCRIIKYELSLEVKLLFTEKGDLCMIYLYAGINTIRKLAEFTKHELRLKTYAMKYQKFLNDYNNKKQPKNMKNFLIGASSLLPSKYVNKNKKLDVKKEKLIINTDTSAFVGRDNSWIPVKTRDLDETNIFHWAPSFPYEEAKENKFQRYDQQDNFHECNVNPLTDEVCDKCSVFRNIDKLRIIFNSIDRLIIINYMRQNKIIDKILLKRNYKQFENQLFWKNLLLKPWNIFDHKAQMENMFFIRNYYGESIAYYFLWLLELVKYLCTIGIIGIGIFIAELLIINDTVNTQKDKDIFQLLLLAFCAVIAIAWQVFLNRWRSTEKMYNYFWGTENYKKSEPDSELFIPDKKEKIIFNVEFSLESKPKKLLKYLLSYSVLLIMIIITVVCVFLLFILKFRLTSLYTTEINGIEWEEYVEGSFWKNVYSSLYVNILFSIMNTIIVKSLNIAFGIMARKLTGFENHQKNFEKTASLGNKLIMFDFVNSYASIFYILFLKGNNPWSKLHHKSGRINLRNKLNDQIIEMYIDNEDIVETCISSSNDFKCMKEIETQLYTTFLINFVLNLVELGMPIFDIVARKVEAELTKQKNKLYNINIEYENLSDSNQKQEISLTDLESSQNKESENQIIINDQVNNEGEEKKNEEEKKEDINIEIKEISKDNEVAKEEKKKTIKQKVKGENLKIRPEINEQYSISKLTFVQKLQKLVKCPQSIEHQLICDDYEDLISEYDEVLILFGYVCLFSCCSPLTPIIIFALAYFERIVDTFKMFYTVRINILDQSTGIHTNKVIMQVFIYIGCITSFAGIIFSEDEFLGQKGSEKVLSYVACIIIIFLITYFCKFNKLPKWFTYLDEIKILYNNKYFIKDDDHLPHFELLEKIEQMDKTKKEKHEKKELKKFSFI